MLHRTIINRAASSLLILASLFILPMLFSDEGLECEQDEPTKEEPPPIGNFALPTSQQPATLFGFGGNIIDKGETQLVFFADEFVGKRRKTIDLVPNIIYGIDDNLTLLVAFPFAAYLRDTCYRSSGPEDFLVQLEYACYNASIFCYTDQATILAGVTAPTGSTHKRPNTGLGSPSLFLGGTYYHMSVDWFWFGAPGALITTSYHRTQFGNQYLYQLGVGRNIPSPEGWIYAWMLEADGLYSTKNKIRGTRDPNSGGNVIYITPSLWISSKDIAIQFGVSLPVHQHLNGSQRKFDYALNFNFAWSIY